MDETNVLTAVESTNSHDSELRHLTGKRFKNRMGPQLVKKAEGWEIIFKCIVSAVINPSVLLEMWKDDGKQNLVPKPDKVELEFFSAQCLNKNGVHA